MDPQAFADLHRALAARGFADDAEALSALLAAAEAQSQERLAISYWTQRGTKTQAALLRSAYAHSRRRTTWPLFSLSRASYINFSPKRTDPAIRLSGVEFGDSSIRLVFSRGGECVGSRRIPTP
jgi:hypothetical protein